MALKKISKMKKYIFLFLFLSGTVFSANAQRNGGGQNDKIQALKIAFFTQKLQLTSADAEKFWPVYNQYTNEIKSLHANNKGGDVIENEQKLLDVRKKYKPSFEKILGSDRLNTFYGAEKEFRNVLIKRLKSERGN